MRLSTAKDEKISSKSIFSRLFIDDWLGRYGAVGSRRWREEIRQITGTSGAARSSRRSSISCVSRYPNETPLTIGSILGGADVPNYTIIAIICQIR